MASAIVEVEPGGATAGGFAPKEVIGVGTAAMGVANQTVIEVPPHDSAMHMHPPPDHHFILFEGIVFGLSIGAIYVVCRAVYEVLNSFPGGNAVCAVK